MGERSAPTDADFEHGRGLLFLLGAFRSGTTLLRKMLDSHPAIHSPAETWFLLPLVNLWEGTGESPMYKPLQAAAALRQHLNQEQFLDCCRAFAGRFYAANMPPGARIYVDKTPPYLAIATALTELFPEARYIVLSRDPRGILWSRHTWKHADDMSLEGRIKGVAGDVRRLAAFYEANRKRSTLVHYEQLCLDPKAELERVCRELDLAFDPRMIQYGQSPHHEGYGDEKTRQHARPHEGSVGRWHEGVGEPEQRELFELCTPEALAVLSLPLSQDGLANSLHSCHADAGVRADRSG